MTARGLCSACYRRNLRAGVLPARQNMNIERAEELFDEHAPVTLDEFAAALGREPAAARVWLDRLVKMRAASYSSSSEVWRKPK